MLSTLFLTTASLAATLPGIDEPLKTGASAPADSAVVVGVEDYFVLPDVPHASRDAAAFQRFLVYTRGVPAGRVRLLDKGASREQILEAVDRAAAETGADGTLWVYFAGHGAASPTDGERLLLGADAQSDLATFEARAVRVSELQARASAGDGQAVLLLDACYSGRGRDGEQLVPGARFAIPASALATSPGVAVWSAASANEWSGPLEPVRHGAFTYLAIGALRGWADGQLDGVRDGSVSAAEAELYVREALVALELTDQRPVLQVDEAGAWVLSSGVSEQGPDLAAASTTPTPASRPVSSDQPFPAAPITRLGGRSYGDSHGAPVPWPTVVDLASQDAAGRLAVRRYRGAGVGQWVAGIAGTAALVVGTMSLGVGLEGDQDDTTDIGMGIAGIVLGAGGIGVDIGLGRVRKARRSEIVEAANRSLR